MKIQKTQETFGNLSQHGLRFWHGMLIHGTPQRSKNGHFHQHIVFTHFSWFADVFRPQVLSQTPKKAILGPRSYSKGANHALFFFCFFDFFHFLNTRCWESVVKVDRVRSCLVERQSLFLRNSQIAPVHCILMYFPILFVDCNSGLRHVVILLLL